MITTKAKNFRHRMKAERESITAVHDDDLLEFLKSIGAYAQIEAGNAKCKFCKDPITLESVRSVFPDSGAIKFVCDKPKCFSDFLDHQVNK